jgi:hypothetical protein
LDGSSFTLTADFIASAAVFSASDHSLFEFGVDVFQSASGSDEGMCVQVASDPYMSYMANKSSPPFEFLCSDDGNGHFAKLPQPVPMPVHDIPAPSCTPPPPPPAPSCDLDWYYCPRDPGCGTYTMSVGTVDVHTHDSAGYKAGDKITVHVNGTTSLTSVPVSGSYRIYTLSGHNDDTGVLSDVMTIPSPGHFELTIPVDVVAGCFSGDWFEFGLDVFQAKSGSDEGMCIEIANPAYVAYQQAKPAPAFNMYCEDHGGGHFTKENMPDGIPEKVSPVECFTS